MRHDLTSSAATHSRRPSAVPLLEEDRILLGDGHGGGAVVVGDRGVGPALQQRPHDPPTALVAGHHSAVRPSNRGG
jgi:hypothetical protein